jgi:hypothetical protein
MASSLRPESEQPQPSAITGAASVHYSPDGRWYWDGQQWRPASAPRSVLASDAERDRALTELNDHYGTGRLNLEEFSQRSETILSARTLAELLAVFQDLPQPSFVALDSQPTQHYPPWISPLLGVPLFLCGLLVLLGVLMMMFPGDVVNARQVGAGIALFFAPLGLYFAITIFAVQRGKTWARGAVTVAAFVIALTGLGLAITIPLLRGLWRRPSTKPLEG